MPLAEIRNLVKVCQSDAIVFGAGKAREVRAVSGVSLASRTGIQTDSISREDWCVRASGRCAS